MKSKLYGRCVFLLALLSAHVVNAQEKTDWMPKIHGTLRAKYEFQPNNGMSRFEVRNARVSIDGKVAPVVSYKAEIDLCDEGKIKMLDAYIRLTPMTNMNVTIGQMRVPFTIDAHRSPHQQYFANRSFIAKQVGNVRDVGATLSYDIHGMLPMRLEAGLFNGSGLTNQKDYWTNSINFSAKAQMFLPHGWCLSASMQKVKPDSIAIMMYDVGAYFQKNGWHVEAEWLRKVYFHGAYRAMSSVDAFASYTIPLKKSFFHSVSPLLRYDYMGDHSDGTTGDDGKLYTTDWKRSRITGGVTLSIQKPFVADIRVNYEKYFYGSNAVKAPSERDKFVIELMTRF